MNFKDIIKPSNESNKSVEDTEEQKMNEKVESNEGD